MNTQTQKVFEDALRLSEQERATLAACLIDSLDNEHDQDHQSAWDAEILRRVEQLDSDAVQPIPWSVARRMILGIGDGTAAG